MSWEVTQNGEDWYLQEIEWHVEEGDQDTLIKERSFDPGLLLAAEPSINSIEITTIRHKETGKHYRGKTPGEALETIIIIAFAIIPMACLTICWNLVTIPLNCLNIKKNIWNIVRAPFYGISIEIIALASVVAATSDLHASYVARVYIGQLEHKWSNGARLSENFPTLWVKKGFVAAMGAKTWYLAPCLQEVGSDSRSGGD